jgi:hypothetical protein
MVSRTENIPQTKQERNLIVPMKPIKTLHANNDDGGIYILRILSEELVPAKKYAKRPTLVNRDFFKVGKFTKGPEQRYIQYRVIFGDNAEMDVFFDNLDVETTNLLEQNVLNALEEYRLFNNHSVTEWVTNVSYDEIIEVIKKEAKKLLVL